jgi:hypothetical protein
MNKDLYGGLAGLDLPCDSFDMGQGITISRTYAYLWATFMMAFKKGEPGKLTPAPWRAAKGGFSFQVLGQVHVPVSFSPEHFFDQLNTIWWFVALLRFRSSPYIVVPVVADGPFADGPKNEEIRFLPMEVENCLLKVEEPGHVDLDALEWIKEKWWSAGQLMNQSTEFNLLFQAHAQCIFTRNPTLALMSLWGALEGLFSPTRTEVTFRVSSNIAAYLEPSGKGRIELQKKTAMPDLGC